MSALTFEQLTDNEAQSCAWALGLYAWRDRKDLNRQWETLMRGIRHQSRLRRLAWALALALDIARYLYECRRPPAWSGR